MPDTSSLTAKIIRQARFIRGSDPRIAVLGLTTATGEDRYALTREGMEQLAALISGNIPNLQYDSDQVTSSDAQ